MGLDIYLYKCDDFKKAKEAEAQFEIESEKIWQSYGEYDDMTEGQREECRSKCASLGDKLGTDKYGTYQNKSIIELDSKTNSEHMFKIGYMRSSYNEGGINRVLSDIGIMDLHDIFGRDDDSEYYFVPDWNKSLVNVNDAILKYDEYINSDLGSCMVMKVSHNPFIANSDFPSSKQQAMNIFSKQINRDSSMKSYSCRDGEFYLDGIKVLGFIPGVDDALLGGGKTPCFYIIAERSEESAAWYKEALLIVKETIEYAVSQADSEKYYLAWSG